MSAVLRPALAVALALFVLAEVNYPRLSPQSQLAIFALLGLVLCFLQRPLVEAWQERPAARALDGLLATAAVACCGYVVVQTEPAFEALWIGGRSLGNRAGHEVPLDVAVGVVGLLLVLEATRRVIGWTLPLLAAAFLAYAFLGPELPAWLLPHRGYDLSRVASQTFLHSQGVFGVALSVMFTYVFLFVLFGAVLEATGATGFVIALAQRLFRASAGGPAKVAVLASGLMGSLSGSAVANTATTGTFTIPLMRSAGFPRRIAGGVEAAASSGGALMPPVMGAGAYMMVELVQVPYLEVIRAALLPALLYYLSLFLIVHFYARRADVVPPRRDPEDDEVTPVRDGPATAPGPRPVAYAGVLFAVALAALLLFLLLGYSAFRAVSLALLLTLAASTLSAATRLTPRRLLEALSKTARDAVPLVAAAACVGIIIGVVTLTGVGTRLPALVLPLAQDSLPAALVLIMLSSIVLGLGLPSAVCYLLVATLMGPALGGLGVPVLAAHLFIFYFGLMSMVTPPVALAAYAASSIAGSRILPTSLAAFRFALVGFTLPYLFVFRPGLLLQGDTLAIVTATVMALAGVLPFAAGIAGFLFAPLRAWERIALLAAAALLLVPTRPLAGGLALPLPELAGFALLAAAALANGRRANLARR